MQAGLRSLGKRVERWAVAGQEAAEGTTAGRGRRQPGCKASVEEGGQDRWLPDRLVVGRTVVLGRVMWAWAELGIQAAPAPAGRADTGPPGRTERVRAWQPAAGGTGE